ncbi:hypothetical protein [Anaeromyxobacter oryzae]|uniref:Tetratricopeptide repeat protein n=1 Tax=Anaeromyxobacter oryzae TaxID=2918170 RepID=A0ABM7WQZ0_9BACT|nr:hypothetical protein [Anaeromyxobacter oryzae]BDG01889.1 hypothetical protein AMOR_08850 [Anaeromyxobacter oryzae]
MSSNRRDLRTGPRTLCLLLLLVTACWRTKADIQRDYARTLAPARLATAPAAAAVRALPVRIYVADDYRAETLRWRERIEAQLARANQILEAQFGVRLVAKETLPWARSGRETGLAAALGDLVAKDPAADVEWVVGFVSSSELFSGSHEQLGMARIFGRHLVLRGVISTDEAAALRETLDALSDRERDALLRERQLHRETAVFLHEWAHTLGAFHERDDESILSPRYHPSAAAFSAVAARIVRLGLDQRAAAASDGHAWGRAYRAEVERGRAAAWDEATVAEALALADALEAQGPPAPPPSAARAAADLPIPAPPAASSPLAIAPAATSAPGDEGAALSLAETNDRLGDAARAWRAVEPVAARHPERGYLQEYACHLRRKAEPSAPATRAACGTGRKLPATEASVLFSRVLVERGDRPGAVAALRRAEAAFAKATPPPPAAAWGELALALSVVGSCTAAERAAARAPSATGSRSAVSVCARTRIQAALPAADPSVDLEREPEYVDAVLRGRSDVDAGRVAAARSAAAALEAAFPRAPGGPLVRCLAEARGGDPAAMRAACAAADRAAPRAPEPPFVLGVVAGHEGRWPDARDHLRTALERDQDDEGTWARLGAVYEKLGDAKELERLDVRYRTRFGRTLRPWW